jgi:V/A-type H+/Na+-transporting ATPase subunit D
MAKIKLTKNEQKKQKDSLKMFRRYLPTLQLKKQQLLIEIRSIEQKQEKLAAGREALKLEFRKWIAVFSESEAAYDLSGLPLLAIDALQTESGNIAGVEIPVFKGASFSLLPYDLFSTPLWVDSALDRLSKMMLLDLEIKVMDEQIKRLRYEFRVTTQRVNLFEKVKIPEAVENIRKIGIYMGDQQTAQVVRGKIAKKNLERISS